MSEIIKADDFITVSIISDGKEVEKVFKSVELLEKELKYLQLLKCTLPYRHEGSSLVLPYCESLDSLLTCPLPPEKASAYILEIIEILKELRAKKIIHRDIKASNLYICDGSLKLADFETVLEVNSENTCGTPGIMAPEQYTNAKVDSRADQYAAGVIFFRILTGNMPFTGSSPEEFMKEQQTVPDPSFYNAKLKQPLCRFLQKILAPNPANRFQSPNDIKLAYDVACAIKKTQPILEAKSVNIGVGAQKKDLKTIKKVDYKRIIISTVIILMTLLLLKKVGGL